MSDNMDYIFYTPPNTEPSHDNSVPFDQDLALLEGKHWMLVQSRANINYVDSALDAGFELSAEEFANVRSRERDARANKDAEISQLEEQILALRAEHQAEWDIARRKAAS